MKASRTRLRLALAGLLALAFALRLGFILTSPAADAAHTPWLVGDSRVFQEHAQARLAGAFELVDLGLPLRPPGTAWLLAQVWDGSEAGLLTARVVFAAIGALVAPLVFLLALPLGWSVAWFAALCSCLAFPLLVLSSTFTAETPYLVLLLLALLSTRVLAARVNWFASLAFGVLAAVTALVRAEHLLVAALLAAQVAFSHRRDRRSMVRFLVASSLGLAITLLPWQIEVARRIESFQTREDPPCPPRSLAWSDEALARLRTVPGFARAATQRFLEVTLMHRGLDRVAVEDLGIVEEAFGVWPEPLPKVVPIALYGPLNFALANAAEAPAGFSRARLDRKPPLRGGADRYSPTWLHALPRDGQLAFSYPPHLDLIAHGYRDGWRELLRDPWHSVVRALEKFSILLRGASGGFGSANAPLGASGPRPSVDLVAADGVVANLWTVVWLALAGVGATRNRRALEVQSLGLFLLALTLVSVGFFGYLRLGALAIPALAMLVGLALREMFMRPRVRLGAFLVLGALWCAEVWRAVAPPSVWVDGQDFADVVSGDGMSQHERRIEVR